MLLVAMQSERAYMCLLVERQSKRVGIWLSHQMHAGLISPSQRVSPSLIGVPQARPVVPSMIIEPFLPNLSHGQKQVP